ncbi:hypothetical protein SAMN05446037_10027 [Anaerovirgula multivorans]|uniref:Uncharacterized protein n=1 Tax=Anaerovirgula multivorans TaxID=312168 RepID=A0A239AHK1_9FIRM|nr:hypothetical protein [Anaerovirgula multivorans]SNR94488.1 hypothetical protein SAMN05446037_10027 [Anaerovirgula multivorans]
MMSLSFLALLMTPIYFVIPAMMLYFVVKLAVKHAIKELKDDRIL